MKRRKLQPELVVHRALIAVPQVVLMAAAFLAALALHHEFDIPADAVKEAFAAWPYLLVLRLVALHRLGPDRGFWRHVGLRDVVRIVLAVTAASLLFLILLLAMERLADVSAAVLVLEWLVSLAFLCGARVVVRCLHERRRRRLRAGPGGVALIVGAGEAGEQLMRQILHDGRCPYRVAGFIDDDSSKLGRSLHGVPVLGTCDDLRRLVVLHDVTHLLVAVPSASGERVRRILEVGMEAGVEIKLVPPLRELVAGSVQLSQVRDVRIDDLLGREPVNLDLGPVAPLIAGKVVLVTGAAGSIGSELARQVARFHPLRIVLVDRAESPLYFVYREIAETMPEVQAVPILASVTNFERMDRIFEAYRPDWVFHAAAYKQVPMLESNIVEGVWNNVIGTLRIARLAARHGVARFVLISTDKAVEPTSILGATKLVAERIVLDLPSLRASATDFRVVRFGNVLGSEGSVVPLFKKQLATGGPLTVTHSEVRRYFMTVPEAVQLVLQASALPQAAGRIALLEMGEQTKILDLAEQLIRLSGFVPYKEVDIVFTGLRPGEKLTEELLGRGEKACATSVDKVRLVERNGSAPHASELARRIRQLQAATASRDEDAILRALTALVPEYAGAGCAPSAQRNGRRGNGRHGENRLNGNGHHPRRNGNGRSEASRASNGGRPAAAAAVNGTADAGAIVEVHTNGHA